MSLAKMENGSFSDREAVLSFIRTAVDMSR